MAKTTSSLAGLKTGYSFDLFVVGPNNHVAVAACMEVVKSPGEAYNPLFIYGPPGVGKTHLIQAAAYQILEANPEFKVRYISAERFSSEILTSLSEDKVLDIRRIYSTLDLLIIDDVQYLVESKVAQEELFHIFNNMHQASRQVILAADRPPNQLTALNKNLRSRLEWGLATDVKVPDETTRIEILKKKQALQNLQLTDDMLMYAAQSLRSNVRELEGFLKRMHAYVNLSHQTITMDLVHTVVKEIAPEGMDAAPEPANGHQAPSEPSKPAKKTDTKPTKKTDGGSGSMDALLQGIDEQAMAEAARQSASKSPTRPPVIDPAPVDIPPPMPVTKNTPTPPPPPPPPEPEPVMAEVAPVEEENPIDEEGNPAHKEVTAVFFYPEGAKAELETVHKKFQEVIKKHKLKFRLKRVHSEPYAVKGKVNYSSFVDVCKINKVPVAVVIGPPPDNMLPQQDFYDLLTVTLDVQGVSLQLVNWSEITKDYRYLNLSLDIALVRSR